MKPRPLAYLRLIAMSVLRSRTLLIGGRARRAGLRGLARLHRIDCWTPPDRNINHPEFLARLRERGVNAAVSVCCPQIFGAELLAYLEYSVNFHTGALPAYRGVFPAAWSLLRGESTTGYAFHRITPGLDEGPVVLSGEIACDPLARAAQLDEAKFEHASSRVSEVLECIVARAPGTPQGPGRIHTLADVRKTITLDRPDAHDFEEVARMIRAFGFVLVAQRGRLAPVTRIARPRGDASGGVDHLALRDGPAVIRGLYHLPPRVYRALAALGFKPNHRLLNPPSRR